MTPEEIAFRLLKLDAEIMEELRAMIISEDDKERIKFAANDAFFLALDVLGFPADTYGSFGEDFKTSDFNRDPITQKWDKFRGKKATDERIRAYIQYVKNEMNRM
jgi:hypothetical protein